MNATESSVDVFNSLLRGELSATETYQQAIAKLDGQPLSAELKKLHADHREAANDLRKHVHELGGKPDQRSGAWGSFAKLVEGTAKMFGAKAALKALKEGEEQGLKDYQSAAENNDLGPKCQMLVGRFLAQTREHIATVDQLIDRA